MMQKLLIAAPETLTIAGNRRWRNRRPAEPRMMVEHRRPANLDIVPRRLKPIMHSLLLHRLIVDRRRRRWGINRLRMRTTNQQARTQ